MDPLDALEVLNQWPVGQPVIKPKGYPFPGTVRAAFTTTEGNVRIVVEHETVGLLHIFAPEQLEPRR